MPLGISELLAAQGLSPPESPAAAAMPHGAASVGGMGGLSMPDPKTMLAVMQAFGGLKQPAAPAIDPMRPPPPVAPQGANAAAIANTGNTSAIASLLAAGLRPGPTTPPLGQLIMGGGR